MVTSITSRWQRLIEFLFPSIRAKRKSREYFKRLGDSDPEAQR
jgi:hypothetical protein